MKITEHPFIAQIPEARQGPILADIETLQLEPEELIFAEGTPADALYLVLEGQIAFTKERNDGTLQEVNESGAGSFFGEVGVFTGERRALGAIAKGKAVVGRVPELTVKKMMEEAGPLRKILASVIQHLSNTTEHYVHDVMRTEKLTLVGTMVSSILHDFKNPFSVISLGSHVIQQRHGDDPKTTAICEKIESQIRRMVDMANDLAAFARGESEIEARPIALEELFSMFRELNEHLFSDESVRVHMNANRCRLEGDSGKLLRVLQNLVSNAIEALHDVPMPGEVRVEASETDHDVWLTVADNGPGIPENIRASFFEPFVTEGKTDGTGLGSAIVQSFIHAHRGEIDFTTSAEGTTFSIRLPKAAGH